MQIDFSTYAPGTVLRVRCRDGVLGLVVCKCDDVIPHKLIRDDRPSTLWIFDNGKYFEGATTHHYDVVRIIGEMVMKTN